MGTEVVVAGTTWTGLTSTGLRGAVLGGSVVLGGPPARVLEVPRVGAAGATGEANETDEADAVGCDPGSWPLLASTALSSAAWAASRWRWTTARAFARSPLTFASVDFSADCCAVAAERSAVSCSVAAWTRERLRESVRREAWSLASAAW